MLIIGRNFLEPKSIHLCTLFWSTCAHACWAVSIMFYLSRTLLLMKSVLKAIILYTNYSTIELLANPLELNQ